MAKADAVAVTAKDLVKIETPTQIEEGDTVYEPVRFGTAEDHVKFNAYRVLRVERGACSVERLNQQGRQREIKLSFKMLLIKKKETIEEFSNTPFTQLKGLTVSSNRSSSAPIATPSSVPPPKTDDAFSAWLAMGKELLDELDTERTRILDTKATIRAELDSLEASHRRRIEDIEKELENAKRAHEQDRELATQRLEALDQKLGALESRKAGVAKILETTDC